jgi:hypothetical protein
LVSASSQLQLSNDAARMAAKPEQTTNTSKPALLQFVFQIQDFIVDVFPPSGTRKDEIPAQIVMSPAE